MNTTLQHNPLQVALSLAGFPGPFITPDGYSVVTAFSIIEQMPVGTKLQTLYDTDGKLIWECVFDIQSNGYYADARQDECPHKAAAKAYTAWKNGLK